MHISHTKSFNIPVSIALATLAHIINVYEICLNKLSDIQYARFQILPMDLPFCTILVSWYPHHEEDLPYYYMAIVVKIGPTIHS